MVLSRVSKLAFLVSFELPFEELFQLSQSFLRGPFFIAVLRTVLHWIETFVRRSITQQTFAQCTTCTRRQLILSIDVVKRFRDLTRYHPSCTFRYNTILKC
ncbi:hypothetical protein D3C75_890530 [compost metagenome]